MPCLIARMLDAIIAHPHRLLLLLLKIKKKLISPTPASCRDCILVTAHHMRHSAAPKGNTVGSCSALLVAAGQHLPTEPYLQGKPLLQSPPYESYLPNPILPVTATRRTVGYKRAEPMMTNPVMLAAATHTNSHTLRSAQHTPK